MVDLASSHHPATSPAAHAPDATADRVITTTTVLIVDPQAMIAEGLAAALAVSGDLEVHILDGTATIAAELAVRPDAVVVLGPGVPGSAAAPTINQVLGTIPDARIVVISPKAEYQTVLQTLEAGASGFLLSAQRVDELADAIRTVRAGGRALAAELVNTLVDRLSAPSSRRVQLTAREVEVLSCLAEGASTMSVADQLGLSVNTVRNHVQSAIRRLGAHSKLEAISIARREGLISGDAGGSNTSN